LGRCRDHLVAVVDPDDGPPLLQSLAPADDRALLRTVAQVRSHPDLRIPAIADTHPDRSEAVAVLVDGSMLRFDAGSGALEELPTGAGRPQLVRLLDDGGLAVADAERGLHLYRALGGRLLPRLMPMRVSGTVHR
jgi:hypothetical protein